jgi:hypothetical protein
VCGQTLALAVLAGNSTRDRERYGDSRAEGKHAARLLIGKTEVTGRAAFQKYAEKVPETPSARTQIWKRGECQSTKNLLN